ncbi:MAG: hypothetical protein IT440_12145, partial [Phycisphaeraceae bacterium]|nr:hypothetical protein [Phycisphaeraceae bacterium]
MKLPAFPACLLVVIWIVASNATADERTAYFPFHGESRLPLNNKVAAVRNALDLSFEKDGILIGKAGTAPEITMPDWHGEQGTVAFWIKPVNWDASTRDHVILVHPLEPKGGMFLIYKYVDDGKKLWFYGMLPTPPNKPTNGRINCSYDGLDTWKIGEWHHVGFTWKKGSRAKLYVDGAVAGVAEGNFFFPESMEGLAFGSGAGLEMGKNTQSILRDLYVTPVVLSDGEINLLARNRPEASGSDNPDAAPRISNMFPFSWVSQAITIDGKILPEEYPSMFSGFIATDTHVAYPEATRFASAADNDSIYVAASVAVPKGYTLNSISNSRDDAAQIAKGDLFCLFICPEDIAPGRKSFTGVYMTLAPNGNVYDAQEKINWEGGGCHRDLEFNAVMDTASVVADGVWTVELKISRRSLGLEKDGTFSFSAGFKLGGNRIAMQDHPVWFDHYQAFSRAMFASVGVKTDFGKLSEGLIALNLSLFNSGKSPCTGQAALKVGLPVIQETAASMVVEKKIGEEIKVELSEVLQDWQEPLVLSPGKATVL